MGDSSAEPASLRDPFTWNPSTQRTNVVPFQRTLDPDALTEQEICQLRDASELALAAVRAHGGNARRMITDMAAFWGAMAARHGGAIGLKNFEMNAHASGLAILSRGS